METRVRRRISHALFLSAEREREREKEREIDR